MLVLAAEVLNLGIDSVGIHTSILISGGDNKPVNYTGTFSKDVFSQGAVNWVFLGLFNYFLY